MRSRLVGVDGLRACAALSVLAYHVCYASDLTQGGLLAPLLAPLKVGVTVFFVLSGFLLYLPYSRALRAGDRLPSLLSFAKRRVARIFPAYWLVLSVIAAASLAPGVWTADWWRFFGLFQSYSSHTIAGGLGIAWSLSAEVAFYAVLPVVAVALACVAKRSHRLSPVQLQLGFLGAAVLAGWAVRGIVAGSLIQTVPNSEMIPVTTLPLLFDWFAIGMALAVVVSEWESGARRSSKLLAMSKRPLICVLLALECYSLVVLQHPGDVFLCQYGLVAHLALGATAGLIVLPVVGRAAVNLPAESSIARRTFLARLGTVSYGIFLWQIPVLELIHGPVGDVPSHPQSAGAVLLLLGAVTLGSVALGAASWYLLEQPILRAVTRSTRPTYRRQTESTEALCPSPRLQLTEAR
jgi:peptidoglycan/LPS O-acetylase OafA/YrhL